jgi:hypothetical protein
MLKMHDDAVDVVALERTADARIGPARTEHEMLDDELAAPGEEIAQRLFPVGAVEHVLLVDPDPRQRAALGAQLVAPPGPRLLLGQQRLARR